MHQAVRPVAEAAGSGTRSIGRLAWLLAAAGTLFFLALKLQQFRSLGVGFELADFEYMLWGTLRGRLLPVDAGGASFFGQHGSPILLGLVPLYGLAPSPVTLLVVQAVVAALAVVPLCHLAFGELGSRVAAVSIGIAYLVSRQIHYGLMYDFHMEIFYPLAFFTLFLAWRRRRWTLYLLALLLAATVKEDAFVALCGVGLFFVALREPRVGWATLACGAAGLALVMGVLIPHFRAGFAPGGYGFLHYWRGYGEDLPSIAAGLLDPARHAEVLLTGAKLRKTLGLLSPFLLLPLLWWPSALLLVLPNWFLLYGSDYRLLHGPLIYYGLLITSLLFVAAILVIGRSARRWPRQARKLTIGLAVAICLLHLANSRVSRWLDPAAWAREPRAEAARALIRTLPSDAPVAAQVHLQAHIPVREVRGLVPRDTAAADYLLLDRRGNPWPFTPQGRDSLQAALLADPGWTLREERDGFLLLQRTESVTRQGEAPASGRAQ